MAAPQVVKPKAWKAEALHLHRNAFVTVLGARNAAREKSSLALVGNIKALSGNFISDRSTGAPSGTPARIRSIPSRSAQSSASRSSSMAMVRLPRFVFGSFIARSYLVVCSIALVRASLNGGVAARRSGDHAWHIAEWTIPRRTAPKAAARCRSPTAANPWRL